MAKISKDKCIATNDYVSAIERFNMTSNRWKNYWWDCIEQIYKNCEEFAKKYIIDPVNQLISETVEKVRKPRKSKYDEIINSNGYNITAKSGEICYLFRFFNDMGELVCSKVGTTTRTIRQRLAEELRSNTYKDMGATHAIVDRVYNCGELPAEGLESLIRSEYIRKYPHSFKKNDRFIGENFDLDYCDKVANSYLA